MEDAQHYYEAGRRLWEYGKDGDEWTEGVTSLAVAANEGHEGALRTLHKICGVSRDGTKHNTGVQRSCHGRVSEGRPAVGWAGVYLGGMYAHGKRFQQDDAKAAQCYDAAARQGHLIGLTNRGRRGVMSDTAAIWAVNT